MKMKILAILLFITWLVILGTNPAFAVSGNCSVYRSWQTGDQLTASDLTTSFSQIGVTQDNPDCQASHATSVTALQTTRQPFQVGLNPDLTPNMTGEIQSLRGLILRLLQSNDSALSSQWYVPPMRFENHSGGNLTAGDVVTLSPSPLVAYLGPTATSQDTPGPRVTTTSVRAARGMIGVALESVAHAAYGRFAFGGIHHLGVTGDVHVGAYLEASGTAKLARATRFHADTSPPPAGAFAIALHATAGPLGASTSHVRAFLFGKPTAEAPDGDIKATDHGARCDGTTDDTTAIRSALQAAAHTGIERGVGGVVTLPVGTCVISNQLVIQNKVVLRGQGYATVLHVTTGIPIALPVIRLGAGLGTALAFGSRIENLEMNLNHVANIGIFSDSANENSGADRVRIINYLTHAVSLVDVSTSLFNENYNFDRLETWVSPNQAQGVAIGVYVNGISKTGGSFTRLMTGLAQSTARQMLYGLYVRDSGTGTHLVTVKGANFESVQAGVFLDLGAGGIFESIGLFNSSGGPGAGITLLAVHSTASLVASKLICSTCTNIVDNASTGAMGGGSSDLRIPFYYGSNTQQGYQVFSAGGVSSTHGNLTGASTPRYLIRSTATSGGASQSFLDFQDGNGDGWRLRNNANATNDPLDFQPITAASAGTAVLSLDDLGKLTLNGGSVSNFSIGGTANRSVTTGTNQVILFDGTAPVGTLANGVSIYSTAGEMRVMDSGGTATLLSPHDKATGEWIFYSKNTNTGQVIRIDMERMMKALNSHFGWDFVREYAEPPGTPMYPTVMP